MFRTILRCIIAVAEFAMTIYDIIKGRNPQQAF